MRQIAFYEAKLQYEIDSWDLSESLKSRQPVVVVDTRSREAYQTEHIPSAINLPHRTISPESTSSLDKSKTYIAYCDGIGCNASTKGALKFAQLGFSTKELLGGLDWWKRDGHPTEGKSQASAVTAGCGCS